jgi:hypothetical protein
LKLGVSRKQARSCSGPSTPRGGRDVPDQGRQPAGHVIEQLRLAGRLEMEFHLLVGPPDEAMPVLLANGYIPGTTTKAGRDRCDREQELQWILDAEEIP